MIGFLLISVALFLNCIRRSKQSDNAKAVIPKRTAHQQMNAEGKAAPEGGEDQQNENDDLRSPPHSARGTDTPLKSKSTTPNKSNPNERRDDANDNKEEDEDEHAENLPSLDNTQKCTVNNAEKVLTPFITSEHTLNGNRSQACPQEYAEMRTQDSSGICQCMDLYRVDLTFFEGFGNMKILVLNNDAQSEEQQHRWHNSNDSIVKP
ncbi:hypothetical protein Tcan_14180 [Toxocara canis]|uniref:Uncharacterized protein n=1 Tax=Toxocara canis TaxID=6265 RepID=A0A0B2UQU4_TOXCA|nr:hypothetical protein Tcan_14180 [Toxocara canis]